MAPSIKFNVLTLQSYPLRRTKESSSVRKINKMMSKNKQVITSAPQYIIKKINYFFHIPLTKTNQEHPQCAHNKYTEVFSYMGPDPLQQGLLQQAPKTIANGYLRTSFQFHKGVICHYFLLQCLPKKQKNWFQNEKEELTSLASLVSVCPSTASTVFSSPPFKVSSICEYSSEFGSCSDDELSP